MGLSIRLSALAILAVAGLAPATALAGTAQAPLWVTHQDVLKGGDNFQVAVSPDSSAVFVAGATNRTSDTFAGVLWAYNAATGAPLWHSTYRGSPDSFFVAATVSPDGSTVYATGWAVPGHGDDSKHFLTVAYDAATGAVLWTSPLATVGMAAGMAVSPDGSAVFVAGDTGTVAYNAVTGATLWTAPAAAVAIAAAHDGSAVYVTTVLPVGFQQHYSAYLTTALGAATGATLWTARYNVRKGVSRPAAIGVTPAGTAVIVTGSTGVYGGPSHFGTVAYNPATGARLWVRGSYQNPAGGSQPRSLGISPDGSEVFVTGSAVDPSRSYGDYATAAYSTATGAPLWTARYRGPANGIGSVGWDLAVSPDGPGRGRGAPGAGQATVFVTGYSWSAGSSGQPEFATVAYDAGTGAQLWAARFGRPAAEACYGSSVAASPDGSGRGRGRGAPGAGQARVFVTGDCGLGAATVAYNS